MLLKAVAFFFYFGGQDVDYIDETLKDTHEAVPVLIVKHSSHRLLVLLDMAEEDLRIVAHLLLLGVVSLLGGTHVVMPHP